jgi:galactose-1-phosphate uridylyltransferase
MLNRETLESLLAINSFSNIPGFDPRTWQGASLTIISDDRISQNKPKSVSYDYAEEKFVIDCSKRSFRPHNKADCAICSGETTLILMENRTIKTPFINLNLFPYHHPDGVKVLYEDNPFLPRPPVDIAIGGSFLQWHSTEHKEIHQLTIEEYFENLKQLREFERFLGESIEHDKMTYPAYFEVFKNVGKTGGRSIPHGHHQVQFSNLQSLDLRTDIKFHEKYRIPHIDSSSHLKQEHNIFDYSSVRSFIKESSEVPFEAVVVPKKQIERLLEADDETLYGFSQAILDVSRGIYHITMERKQPLAYNMMFHTGIGIGKMYVKFMPRFQIRAGYEELGTCIRQMNPGDSSMIIKEKIRESDQLSLNYYSLEPTIEA